MADFKVYSKILEVSENENLAIIEENFKRLINVISRQNQHNLPILIIGFIGEENEKAATFANMITNLLMETACETFERQRRNTIPTLQINEQVSEGIYYWPELIPLPGSQMLLSLFHANPAKQRSMEENPFTKFLEKVCHRVVHMQSLTKNEDEVFETTKLTIMASPSNNEAGSFSRPFEIRKTSRDNLRSQRFVCIKHEPRNFVNAVIQEFSLTKTDLRKIPRNCQKFIQSTVSEINFPNSHEVWKNSNQQEKPQVTPIPKPRQKNTENCCASTNANNKGNKEQTTDTQIEHTGNSDANADKSTTHTSSQDVCEQIIVNAEAIINLHNQGINNFYASHPEICPNTLYKLHNSVRCEIYSVYGPDADNSSDFVEFIEQLENEYLEVNDKLMAQLRSKIKKIDSFINGFKNSYEEKMEKYVKQNEPALYKNEFEQNHQNILVELQTSLENKIKTISDNEPISEHKTALTALLQKSYLHLTRIYKAKLLDDISVQQNVATSSNRNTAAVINTMDQPQYIRSMPGNFQPPDSTNQVNSNSKHLEETPNNPQPKEVNGGLVRMDSVRKKTTRTKHLPYIPDALEPVKATQNINLSHEDVPGGLNPIHRGQNQKDVSKPTHLPEISGKHDPENNIHSVTNEAGTPCKSRTESITTTQSENQFGSYTQIVPSTQPNSKSPTDNSKDDPSARTLNESQTNAFGLVPKFYSHGDDSKDFEREASDELSELTHKQHPTKNNDVALKAKSTDKSLKGYDVEKLAEMGKTRSYERFETQATDKQDAANSIYPVKDEDGTPEKTRTKSNAANQSKNLQSFDKQDAANSIPPVKDDDGTPEKTRTNSNAATQSDNLQSFVSSNQAYKQTSIKLALDTSQGDSSVPTPSESETNNSFTTQKYDSSEDNLQFSGPVEPDEFPETIHKKQPTGKGNIADPHKNYVPKQPGKLPPPTKPRNVKSTVDATKGQPRKGGRIARKSNSPGVNLEKSESYNPHASDDPKGKNNTHLNLASECSVTEEAKIRRTTGTSNIKYNASECLTNLEFTDAVQDTSLLTNMNIVFYISCDYIGVAINDTTEMEPVFYPATIALTTNDEWMIGEDERTKTALHVWKLSKIWDSPDYNYWKGNSIYWNGKKLEPTIEFLLSVIFISIRKEFASYLSVNQATFIATPFWFTSSQRQQILDAALLAGFKKANIVNENTSLAYYMLAEGFLSNEKLVVISESHNTLDIAVYEFKRCKAPLMLASSEPIFIKKSPKIMTKHPRGIRIEICSKLEKVWTEIKTKQLKNANIIIRVLVSYESELLLEGIQTFAESISKENLLLLKKEPALQGLFCINKTKLHNQDQGEAIEELLYDGTSYSICVTSPQNKSFEEHISRISVASFCEHSATCKLLKKPFQTYYVKQVINSYKSWVVGTIRLVGPIDKNCEYTATFGFSVDGIIFLQKIEKRTKTAVKYRPSEIVDSSIYSWMPSKLSENDKKEFKQILLPEECLNENYDNQSVALGLSTPVSKGLPAKTKSSFSLGLKNGFKSVTEIFAGKKK